MVQHWNGQFCLKGVMSPADAKRAAEIGCTGIVVSNHGGRQLDGSRASFDQLAEIVDAVGDRIDVFMDGGVQRGTHVLNPDLNEPRCSLQKFPGKRFWGKHSKSARHHNQFWLRSPEYRLQMDISKSYVPFHLDTYRWSLLD